MGTLFLSLLGSGWHFEPLVLLRLCARRPTIPQTLNWDRRGLSLSGPLIALSAPAWMCHLSHHCLPELRRHPLLTPLPMARVHTCPGSLGASLPPAENNFVSYLQVSQTTAFSAVCLPGDGRAGSTSLRALRGDIGRRAEEQRPVWGIAGARLEPVSSCCARTVRGAPECL